LFFDTGWLCVRKGIGPVKKLSTDVLVMAI